MCERVGGVILTMEALAKDVSFPVHYISQCLTSIRFTIPSSGRRAFLVMSCTAAVCSSTGNKGRIHIVIMEKNMLFFDQGYTMIV